MINEPNRENWKLIGCDVQTSHVAEQSSRLVIYDNIYWELLQVLYTMLLHYPYGNYKTVSSSRVHTSFLPDDHVRLLDHVPYNFPLLESCPTRAAAITHSVTERFPDYPSTSSCRFISICSWYSYRVIGICSWSHSTTPPLLSMP